MNNKSPHAPATLRAASTALAAFLFAAVVALPLHAGVNKGNGGCYATEPPDPAGTAGKYCGKGDGSGSGSGCDCGTFITAPVPFDGLDIVAVASAQIDGLHIPLGATGLFTVQLWNGAAYVNIGNATPGVTFPLPGGLQRVRIEDILLGQDVDLGNDAVFPIGITVLGGGLFSGTKAAFASTMAVVLSIDADPAAPGTTSVVWYGGSGPFTVQISSTPAGPWTFVGSMDERNLSLTSSLSSYLRVLSSDTTSSNVLDISASAGVSICAGDGSLTDHTTPCPCGNNGAAGNGCGHSFDANGANLSATGSVAADDIVLHSQFAPVSAFTLFLQHSAGGDTVFHDGVICAGGTLIRLRGRACVAGEAFFPNSNFANDSTVTLSQRGGTFPGSGQMKRYAAWYRNASSTFCPPATANVTNGWVVNW